MSLELPCDSAAPRKARRALEKADHLGGIMRDVMLVASELVTNAIRHSGCSSDQTVRIDASWATERVRISVCDPGVWGRTAQARQPNDLTDGGIGLRIVDQLADRWGTERNGGYRVWAEITVLEPAPA